MRVRVLASSSEHRDEAHYLTSYLINDRVAIDAGCVGLYRKPEDQLAIEHVFVTHTHADHVSSLPIFLGNTLGEDREELTIHGQPSVLESLEQHIFNDCIWPNLTLLSSSTDTPIVLAGLAAEEAVMAAGFQVTPVPVDHTVPTMGYIVDDGSTAVVFGADSGPTDRIWELASEIDHLRAVFLEASFPNEMEEHALLTGHLTPRLFKAEANKMPDGVRMVATHIKTRYRDVVVRQLLQLELPDLIVGEGGHEYTF